MPPRLRLLFLYSGAAAVAVVAAAATLDPPAVVLPAVAIAAVVATALARWRLHSQTRLKRFERVVKAMQLGVLVYRLEKVDDDSSLRIVHVNPAAYRLLGVEVGSLLRRTIDEAFPALRANDIPRRFADVVRTATPFELVDFDYGDDRVVDRAWAFKAFPLSRDCVGVLFEDVTDRKRAEDALRVAKGELEERIAERTAELQAMNTKLTGWVRELELRSGEITTLSQMADMLQACISIDEAYAIVGRYGEQLFPETTGAIFLLSASRNYLESVAAWGETTAVKEVFKPDDCWSMRRGRIHRCSATVSGSLFCDHVASDVWRRSLCIPLMAQGEALGVLILLARGEDPELPAGQPFALSTEQLATTVAEQVALSISNLRLRETLRSQAIRDPLTTLFNRRYLEETLECEFHRAARHRNEIALMVIDIDHFKMFNDTFGHPAGDALIRELGTFLRAQVRGGDIPCRYGGEEFVVVLPFAGLANAYERAEQIRTEAKHISLTYGGQLLGPITLSIGVAAYPNHGKDPSTVLKAADTALYRAKAGGRDRVVIQPASASTN